MPAFHSLIGHQFGRLTVVRRAPNKGMMAQWICQCRCGGFTIPQRTAALRAGRVISCGCAKKEYQVPSGVKSPNWKGGRRSIKSGYVQLRIAGRYIFEHIVVMERQLGRKLYPDETVHHKNSIRSDNTPDNLEIRVKGKHPHGATIPDLLKWADELIVRYR